MDTIDNYMDDSTRSYYSQDESTKTGATINHENLTEKASLISKSSYYTAQTSSEIYAPISSPATPRMPNTRKTLILDLDDTLVKTRSYDSVTQGAKASSQRRRRPSFQVYFDMDGKLELYFVYER